MKAVAFPGRGLHDTRYLDSEDIDGSLLRQIVDTLTPQVAPQVTPQVTPEIGRLLSIMQGEMRRSDIQAALGLKDAKHFRAHYLQPALEGGLIEMTVPDRPQSRLQRYRLVPPDSSDS